VLPSQKQQDEGFAQGLQRAIRLEKTFEKLGYAVDPYLGNLTVSPRNLGTALKVKCTLKVEAPASSEGKTAEAVKELSHRLFYESGMVFDQDASDLSLFHLETKPTLQANLNEKTQI